MFYVSEITHEAPEEFENETQRLIYKALADLDIPFDRVKNDFIISMEDCEEVNKKLWRGKDGEISTPGSRVKVAVVLTDEEYMIARDTEAIVEGRQPE